MEVEVERGFAAVEVLPVVPFTERRDDEFQAVDHLPLDAFLVFGEGLPEFGIRLGRIIKGIQEHLPIGLIQHYGLVFLDHLVGRVQRLAEHEF